MLQYVILQKYPCKQWWQAGKVFNESFYDCVHLYTQGMEFFKGLELVQTVNYAVAETVVHIMLYANNQCPSR